MVIFVRLMSSHIRAINKEALEPQGRLVEKANSTKHFRHTTNQSN